MKDKSYQFAVETVRFCREVDDRSVRPIVTQFLRAGTSIGANVEEAVAGQSRNDFRSKMSIACKEAREAKYWLRLFRDADVIKDDRLTGMLNLSEELICLLTAIVKTTSKGSD